MLSTHLASRIRRSAVVEIKIWTVFPLIEVSLGMWRHAFNVPDLERIAHAHVTNMRHNQPPADGAPWANLSFMNCVALQTHTHTPDLQRKGPLLPRNGNRGQRHHVRSH